VGRRVALLTAAIVIAAIGTTLVYLYAKQANDRALADQNPVDVLVASVQIPAGTSVQQLVDDQMVEPQATPQKNVPTTAIPDLGVVTGQVTRTPIYPGQQLLTDFFGESVGAVSGINIPEGQLAASFSFGDTARVAGFVNAGSDVAVFLTSPAASNDEEPTTRLLLPKVTILAVGATTVTPPVDPTQANPEVFPRATMTIAVTQKQLETLVFAQTQGELYLGLRNDESNVEPNQGTNVNNLFN
jgi:pilus assembly protein CpaB